MAEIKRVPAIRFKSDLQEWDEKTLLELSENGFTNGVFNDPTKQGGRYKLVNVLDMYIDSTIDEKRLNFVDIGEAEFAKNKVENGDVFFTRSSLVKEGIAYSNTYLGNSQDITFDGHLIRMRPKKHLINSCFLNYLLKTSYARKQLVQRGKTATMTTIGQADIAPVSVIFPKRKDEQTQIGSYFQHLDKLISLHQTKVNKLTNLKKAMLEKMFPKLGADEPEIRFKGFAGAWDEDDLGQLSKITTGSSNRVDSGVDGEYTFFDRSDDIRTSNIYLFDCEAVIVAGEGSDFVPKYFVGKFDLHQRTYAIMNFDKLVGKFLYYYIYLFRKHFLDYAVGSTVKSLRLPMFKEMPIKYPNEAEQEKIGSYFYNLDKSITLHQTELEKLNNLKKACLEKMFV
jgi:type I restriction enzyme S subunit